jgi:hypothetical protein
MRGTGWWKGRRVCLARLLLRGADRAAGEGAAEARTRSDLAGYCSAKPPDRYLLPIPRRAADEVSIPRHLELGGRLRCPRTPRQKPARAGPDDGRGLVLSPLAVVRQRHRCGHAGQGTTGPIVFYASRSLVLER